MVRSMNLAELLDRETVAGRLVEPMTGDRVRCTACAHRCTIYPGKRGVCKVRLNVDGELRVPFGYVGGIQGDPVEKKPYFHVHPGSDAMTFGMLGCDYHCGFCQNWITSQALRDDNAVASPRTISAASLVGAARQAGSRLVVSSYNEPLITSEWSHAVFREARRAGFLTGFVSNGNATPEALDYIAPLLDCYKVDLKSMQERRYREMGGMLAPVLETIAAVHARGLWLEIVTLIIPGFNDADAELREAARFIADISPDIPWHVTAFHKNYRMTDPDNTSPETLVRAAEIGAEAGLRYVYAGNRPGQVGDWENTRCPHCATTLIARFAYVITDYRITHDGCCGACKAPVAGLWPASTSEVRIGTQGDVYSRRPRSVDL